MRANHGHAGPVWIFFARLLVEVLQSALPVLPIRDVVASGSFVGSEQRRQGLLSGLGPNSAKAECEYEFAVASREVDLGSERDVAILRAVVLPGHLKILRQILPAVRRAGKSDRTFEPGRRTRQRQGVFEPGRRTRQRQGGEIALGKEHRLA